MTDDLTSNDTPTPEPDPAVAEPVPAEPAAVEAPEAPVSTERRDRHGSLIGETKRRQGPGMGQIVVGGFLILIGTGWLLEASDVADVPWRALLPAALLLIGAGLIVGSRTARHGGVIALGVVLSLAVGAASAIEVLAEIPISGGIGEERATVVGPIEAEYRHAIGEFVVDLRSGEVAAAGQEAEISLGIGELVVIVPEGIDIVIDARAGIGNVVLFGEQSSGLGPDLEFRTPDATEGVLRLDIDIAIGQLEVRR